MKEFISEIIKILKDENFIETKYKRIIEYFQIKLASKNPFVLTRSDEEKQDIGIFVISMILFDFKKDFDRYILLYQVKSFLVQLEQSEGYHNVIQEITEEISQRLNVIKEKNLRFNIVEFIGCLIREKKTEADLHKSVLTKFANSLISKIHPPNDDFETLHSFLFSILKIIKLKFLSAEDTRQIVISCKEIFEITNKSNILEEITFKVIKTILKISIEKKWIQVSSSIENIFESLFLKNNFSGFHLKICSQLSIHYFIKCISILNNQIVFGIKDKEEKDKELILIYEKIISSYSLLENDIFYRICFSFFYLTNSINGYFGFLRKFFDSLIDFSNSDDKDKIFLSGNEKSVGKFITMNDFFHISSPLINPRIRLQLFQYYLTKFYMARDEKDNQKMVLTLSLIKHLSRDIEDVILNNYKLFRFMDQLLFTEEGEYSLVLKNSLAHFFVNLVKKSEENSNNLIQFCVK